nr:hypothetical protein GCM10020092_071730 [Actinoplanes digitatis]
MRFSLGEFHRLSVRDVDIEFRGIHADGGRVIVEETMTATLANGNHYANDYCFVFELRDGLIHRVREYMDTARGHRTIFGTGPVGRGELTAFGLLCCASRQLNSKLADVAGEARCRPWSWFGQAAGLRRTPVRNGT